MECTKYNFIFYFLETKTIINCILNDAVMITDNSKHLVKLPNLFLTDYFCIFLTLISTILKYGNLKLRQYKFLLKNKKPRKNRGFDFKNNLV